MRWHPALAPCLELVVFITALQTIPTLPLQALYSLPVVPWTPGFLIFLPPCGRFPHSTVIFQSSIWLLLSLCLTRVVFSPSSLNGWCCGEGDWSFTRKLILYSPSMRYSLGGLLITIAIVSLLWRSRYVFKGRPLWLLSGKCLVSCSGQRWETLPLSHPTLPAGCSYSLHHLWHFPQPPLTKLLGVVCAGFCFSHSLITWFVMAEGLGCKLWLLVRLQECSVRVH